MTHITLSTAWLVGIAAAHYVNPPLMLIGLLAMLPLPGFFLWRDDPKVRGIAVCGLFLLLGSLRYTLSLPDLPDPGHIVAYGGREQVTLWGHIVREPDAGDTYTNLRLAVDRVPIEDEEHPVKGTILIQAPRYPAHPYGDELDVEGLLETPPVFEGSSCRDYLARQGICGLLRRPQITLLKGGRGSPAYRALLALKGRAQAIIAHILP
jgi:hypothetical protein